MGFLYFLLFILFLSILIVIHELGHFTAAKIFKIYIAEFSIGFGPALIHKRKEGKETYFSLRAIPFGGYVAMYGEGGTRPEGAENVPESRSLAAQKRWKQAIIMVAGVTMNVFLAIIMFFISEQACPQYSLSPHLATYSEDSIVLKQSGLDPNKAIYMRGVTNADGNSTYYAWIDGAMKKEDATESNRPFVTTTDGRTVNVAVCIDQSKININQTSYNNALVIFETYEKEIDKKLWIYPDISKKVDLTTIKDLTFTPSNSTYKLTEDGKLNAQDDTRTRGNPVKVNVTDGKFQELGMNFYLEKYFNNYQGKSSSLSSIGDNAGKYDDRNAIRKAFVDFGNSSTVIFKGLGSLFTPDGWKNVGGIIAIGVTTSQTLQNFGIGKFLFYWGMISVNLAIVNILPFPGLDGWHLLVIGIEGTTKKKIPEKAKTIVSLIGIGFLFILMILIIIKDIMMFV